MPTPAEIAKALEAAGKAVVTTHEAHVIATEKAAADIAVSYDNYINAYGHAAYVLAFTASIEALRNQPKKGA